MDGGKWKQCDSAVGCLQQRVPLGKPVMRWQTGPAEWAD